MGGMRRLCTFLAAGLLVSSLSPLAQASSRVPRTEAQEVRAATGICLGRVERIESFRHPQRGGIFTRVTINVLEGLKGRFPAKITLVQRGGTVGDESEASGANTALRIGEERLFHLLRRADGSLEPLGGSAVAGRVTNAFASQQKLRRVRQLAAAVQSAALITGEDFSTEAGVQQASSGGGGGATSTGLLVDGSGIPNRFLAPDRGEPIGYLVDAEALPTGVTQAQALTAVSQALAAWSAVTGITFRYDGLQNFGMSAADVTTQDERLRIQLHDLYNEIPASSVLGIGGYASTNVSSDFTSTGGGGGQVNGLEFHKTTRGYVVLEHGATSLQSLTTLAEVLCHEVGHALSMAHSSENPSEPDTALKQAVMYYQAHADGRGAALGSYDGPIIQKAHPLADKPPYSYDRIVPLVSAPSPITGVAGINELALAGYDLQTPSTSLTLVTTGPVSGSAATVSFTGSTLKLTQAGYYGDSSVDTATSSFFVLKWVRFSDGVHCSPWSRVRVVNIYSDSGGDGLPNSWSTTHFGSATPSAAALTRAGDDKDGDGLTNLTEFLLGTVPVNAVSRLRVTSLTSSTLEWPASPYALYTVESSSDLATWSRFGNPIVPTTSTGSASGNFVPAATTKKFYRVKFGP